MQGNQQSLLQCKGGQQGNDTIVSNLHILPVLNYLSDLIRSQVRLRQERYCDRDREVGRKHQLSNTDLGPGKWFLDGSCFSGHSVGIAEKKRLSQRSRKHTSEKRGNVSAVNPSDRSANIGITDQDADSARDWHPDQVAKHLFTNCVHVYTHVKMGSSLF